MRVVEDINEEWLEPTPLPERPVASGEQATGEHAADYIESLKTSLKMCNANKQSIREEYYPEGR